ncbi:hypothetical protein PO461_22805 [Enterobacter asburiae]|uniref:hypothetical protein n=1 Tax=Enterobacter asburiae TaxID=61645 RepID=UPI002FF8A291
MHDRVIIPARVLVRYAMDCTSAWEDVLLPGGGCAAGWLLVRAAARHLRVTGAWTVLARQWLVPVLILSTAAGLLLSGDGCRNTRQTRLLAEALRPDTRCAHPEISGVTLSRACQESDTQGASPADKQERPVPPVR